MNKTKTPIPEIVEDGLACYELWVKAPRNKKFEMSQIRNSIQGGYRLDQMLLWLYRRADSAQYISKPLAGVLGGIAWKLDRNYGRAHD